MSPFVRPAAVRRADRLLAASVFFVLLGAFTATFTGIPDNHDAEVEFQTTSALWRTRSFAIGGTPEADAILGAESGGRRGFAVERGVDGRYYAWFGVGQALAGLPFYAVGRLVHRAFPEYERRHNETFYFLIPRTEYFEHLVVGWRNSLWTALTAWLLVKSARRVGAKRAHAWIAGLSYGLCTFAWPQARSTMSDVQATFFLFLSLHVLLVVRERLQRFRDPGPLTLAALGASLGAAFLTRVVTAPAILVLVLATLFVLRSARARQRALRKLPLDLAAFCAPALASVALFLALNHARFGNALETGYGAVVFGGGFFAYPWHVGAFWLLCSPGKGLFWLAPGVLLLPFWLVILRRQRDTFLAVLVVALCLAIAAPIVPKWYSGWTYGPRYVLPLLPVVWLGVGPVLNRAQERGAAKLAVAFLLAFGFVANLPGVLVDHVTHEELGMEAARILWPDAPGVSEEEREDVRFQWMQSDWRLAAPWAHWRILRHRAAGLGEEFPLREIFLMDDDRTVTPSAPRLRGFEHFAWVDFAHRLGGPASAPTLICFAAIALGALLAVLGLDPNRP